MTIADILSDAAGNLREVLADRAARANYSWLTIARSEGLIKQMDRLREELDRLSLGHKEPTPLTAEDVLKQYAKSEEASCWDTDSNIYVLQEVIRCVTDPLTLQRMVDRIKDIEHSDREAADDRP